MLTVPEDLILAMPRRSTELPQATVVDYVSEEDLLSERVLVSQPTLVLIRAGVKQFSSSGSERVHLAPAESLIVFRSGSHMMSEFLRDGPAYQSFVVSLDRGFLRQAIGMPPDRSPGDERAAVVTSLSADRWAKLMEMPSTVGGLSSETEREFRLREFIVHAMDDDVVRNLLYDEVQIWGTTVEHRISSVLHAHSLSPLRIEDLAMLSGMSLASFKRHFRTIFDASPGEWLQRTRLRHAHDLALHSELSTKEICEATGYLDVSSFTRAFRRQFGETPLAIRRRQGT